LRFRFQGASYEIDEVSGLQWVARPLWISQRLLQSELGYDALISQAVKVGPAMKLSRLSTAALLAIVSAPPALADLSNCENLYVGRIWIERGSHLRAVVLLNAPSDGSGSYWIFFDTWSLDERKAALATLTAAKLVGHRVHVTTDDTTQCGITTGGTHAKAVFLATNP
jgi:hypothetical protein